MWRCWGGREGIQDLSPLAASPAIPIQSVPVWGILVIKAPIKRWKTTICQEFPLCSHNVVPYSTVLHSKDPFLHCKWLSDHQRSVRVLICPFHKHWPIAVVPKPFSVCTLKMKGQVCLSPHIPAYGLSVDITWEQFNQRVTLYPVRLFYSKDLSCNYWKNKTSATIWIIWLII